LPFLKKAAQENHITALTHLYSYTFIRSAPDLTPKLFIPFQNTVRGNIVNIKFLLSKAAKAFEKFFSQHFLLILKNLLTYARPYFFRGYPKSRK